MSHGAQTAGTDERQLNRDSVVAHGHGQDIGVLRRAPRNAVQLPDGRRPKQEAYRGLLPIPKDLLPEIEDCIELVGFNLRWARPSAQRDLWTNSSVRLSCARVRSLRVA